MKKILLFITLTISVVTLSLICNNQVVAWEYDGNENIYFDYIATYNESYYSSLSNLSGDDFRDELNDIITNGYTRYTYSNRYAGLRAGDAVYNDSSSVWCLYTGKIFGAYDNGSSGTSSWNTEHTWAKSWGFPSESSTPYSDLHHLRITECATNSTRGNLWFGEVTSGSSDAYGNKWSSSIFEPRDSVKGDVARMLLYMDVRYDGENGEPDLVLINGYSSTSGSALHGDLETLLKWHEEDPVDDRERKRNDVIYSYQKNRNPFVDHPEYVNVIWGDGELVEPDTGKALIFDEMVLSINSNITLDSFDEIATALAYYKGLTDTEKEATNQYPLLQTYYQAYIDLGGTDEEYFDIYSELLDDMEILDDIIHGDYESLFDSLYGN